MLKDAHTLVFICWRGCRKLDSLRLGLVSSYILVAPANQARALAKITNRDSIEPCVLIIERDFFTSSAISTKAAEMNLIAISRS